MRDGREATVDEVTAEIENCRSFITTARRGVTITGGEPLLQSAFTGELPRRCKEAGLHTAVDTSGFLGARASDDLLADTDLMLLDVKSFDVNTYRKLTGGELAPTLSFATRLDRVEAGRRPALPRTGRRQVPGPRDPLPAPGQPRP